MNHGTDFAFDFTGVPAGVKGRSDWEGSIPDEKIRAAGDPVVFQGQPIRVAFRVSKGEVVLPSDEAVFRFAFYKKTANGNLDMKDPFKTIVARIER